MNRRSFMALASGLLVPWEPERVYSFLPAWRLVTRSIFDAGWLPIGAAILADASHDPESGTFRSPKSVGIWAVEFGVGR